MSYFPDSRCCTRPSLCWACVLHMIHLWQQRGKSASLMDIITKKMGSHIIITFERWGNVEGGIHPTKGVEHVVFYARAHMLQMEEWFDHHNEQSHHQGERRHKSTTQIRAVYLREGHLAKSKTWPLMDCACKSETDLNWANFHTERSDVSRLTMPQLIGSPKICLLVARTEAVMSRVVVPR